VTPQVNYWNGKKYCGILSKGEFELENIRLLDNESLFMLEIFSAFAQSESESSYGALGSI